jgi:HSP20 family protein
MFRGGLRPARDIESLKKEIDRLWERLKTRATSQGAWSPPIDLAETDENVIVRAELPGVDAKAIDISLAGQVLTIRGERAQTKDEGETVHFAETDYGRFVRRIDLPLEVDPAGVRAEYRHGMLRIVLPKTAEAREREVKISVG